MAKQTRLTATRNAQVILRIASPESDELLALLLRRYPSAEWATFARFGWRWNGNSLVLTLAKIDGPVSGDLDDTVGHVAIREPYTLRMALAAETHPLAIGIIHSHPEGCAPRPSYIDDDMDGYYSDYFKDFAPARPYISMILSRMDGNLSVSGRVHYDGQWLDVVRVFIERTSVRTWVAGLEPEPQQWAGARTARLTAAFGLEASSKLRGARVAVIGAGGTGSAAIEVLARAGVGHLIIIDPDYLEESNLERVHGSSQQQAQTASWKVEIAREHVFSIDPSCEVRAFVGALPQGEIIDEVATADVALGCTDQQHSRLALSDVAVRYLVPAIDCGVMLEGKEGRVTGQIIQIIRFLAADPCALCRNLTDAVRLSQELMPESERNQRRRAAASARKSGQDGNQYWNEIPQLNTVGYLTTTAGALAAGYAIGWLTGRFDVPFSRLQMNLSAKLLDVTDFDQKPRPDCACRFIRGWADQGAAHALITAPAHWPAPQAV